MSEPYVPSEALLRAAWSDYCQSMDDCNVWVRPGGIDTRAEFDRFLARVRRDAQIEAAQMIRDACDRWEVDGDDERLVNDVLDPWTSRVLTPKEDDR